MTEKGELPIQSREFGYDPTKVWYRDRQHLQTINGMYRGVQAIVHFENIMYSDVFDRVLINLKKFADKGTEDFGWRPTNEKSKWGQHNDVVLPNHQKYRIVDKTEEGDKGITLSIRHEKGSYNFTGRGKYNVRAIDISDARIKMRSVKQVMREIKAIVKAVSEN